MTTKQRKKTNQPTSPYLPISSAIWDFHLAVLGPLMQSWKKNNGIPPVTLFTGVQGQGKRALIHHLAQCLLCHDLQDQPGGSSDKPCGSCKSCTQACKNQWLDFVEILPEKSEKGVGKIKIDQFRKLKSQQGFGAHEGRYRIFHIGQAERLTVQAANSLLKILEEPPADWLFFLTSSDPSLLLPTLVARCNRVRLQPLPTPTLKTLLAERLGEISAANREIAAHIAHGSLDYACKILDEEVWKKRSRLFKFLERPQNEFSNLLDWAASDSDHMMVLLDQMDLITYDLIRWSVHCEKSEYPWINQDGIGSLTLHAKRVLKKQGSMDHARQVWLDRAQGISQIRKKIHAPLARKLLAQELLTPWVIQ